ncbi:MAG: hypothetical protein K2X99_11700 [Gemmatimonadaceae bacterium]|nr:hypothetical protein [Gemmatimonadaceae bacterium]
MTRAALLMVVSALAACGRGATTSAPPRTELLVASADSTFWVTSDERGVRMRGAPLVLARVDGSFYELYTADDDRSYYDATFVGLRLFRRALSTGDSVELWRDRTVERMATTYAEAHPDERPLREDEDGALHPRTVATTALDLLDTFGGFLAMDHRTDVDVVGGQHDHTTHRTIIDLRTADTVDVSRFLHAARSEGPLSRGSTAWWQGGSAVLESVGDAAGERARLALTDGRRGRWAIGAVTGTVRRVYWLPSGLAADTRRSLERAFDEAAFYSDQTRTAQRLAPRAAATRNIPVIRRAPVQRVRRTSLRRGRVS